MKKNQGRICYLRHERLLNVLLMTKFILFLIIVSTLQSYSKGFGQTAINLNLKNVSLKTAFREIEKKSDYHFLYNDETIRHIDKLKSIEVSNASIHAVMDLLTSNTAIKYQLGEDNTVIIYLNGAQFNAFVVKGKVTDDNSQPLPGVSVRLKGTSTGTQTDLNGNYSLNVPDGSVYLVFTYTGFEAQEVNVDSRAVIDIKLKAKDNSLSEVVVVGYGVQRKSDLTGAVTSIKSADLTKIGGSNAAEALQGKIPGVQILSQGGPGAAPTVLIRGLGTNGDPTPLYVVDGMMVTNISFLAPNDIASMEILKDASATAIYGSRGANGVILVTTKKGKPGKPVINFLTSQGFQFLTRKFHVANSQEYAQLVNLFKTNAGAAPVYDNISQIGAGTDWTKEVTQNGIVSDYQLSVGGGSENVNYNISASYHNEDGVLKYTNYNRLTLRADNEYKISKKLTFGHNLSLASSHYNGDGGSNTGRGINSITRISPLIPVYKSDGSFSSGQDVDIVNPFAELYLHKDAQTHPLQFVGNGYLNYELFKGLTFRSSYGVDYTLNNINRYTPPYNLGANQSSLTSIENGYTAVSTWLWENTLTYDKQLGASHHLNLLAGYTAQNTDYRGVDVTGSGPLTTTDPNYRYIQVYPISNINSLGALPSSESILSYLFRANYSYKDRYLLTASFRGDGSSKFAEGHRWGYFPSVALGWRASEEKFLKNVSWINNLKVRGSWGRIGSNKIANYQTFNLLNQETTYDGVFNGVFYPMATIVAASNPNITWEVSQQTDAGIEFGTLKNRLRFEGDYYRRDTKNLLLILPVPGGSTGTAPAYSNAGTVRNSGVELAVSWNDRIGGLGYGVKVTGTANKNRILDFKGLTSYTSDFQVPSTHVSKAGAPIGDFYGYQSLGIVQSQAQIDQLNATAASKSGNPTKQYWSGLKPGDLLFKDINGDGFVDANDKTDIGSPYAKFVGGLTLSADYKGFDLTIDMMGSFGGKIYNDTRNQFVSSGLSNLNVEWLDSWTPTHTNTTIPRYAVNTSTTQSSDFNIFDGTYIKARFIELGYTFNKQLLKRVGISGLRVYVNTTNPFYITKYKGFSPEVSNAYGVSTIGDDFRTYPVSGTARLGINLTF
ncbi:TonB-linked outer membrane protein, SusC/RagA family [Mucilaginibacter gossypii]|uniref:TonB-linked outer membrane protein, SusC/RagA family n=2 Tax=Mucilaginibacter gossypii TaxID=551996 RepID=A0A1G8BVY1_9SPHI|nr:TonB-linked outer membrane protein, SusC/RagA family [Mucilaginibacter gossypii]